MSDESVYCASPPAVVAAAAAAYPELDADALAAALIAAHHPSLGLGRSVCLRDVVEALRSREPSWNRWGRTGARTAADYIEREFGQS